MTKTLQQSIDKNYAFYKENAQKIAEKYGKGYVIISDERIVWNFDEMVDAYNFWVEKYWLWNFIVQNVDYFWSIQYLSRLSFA